MKVYVTARFKAASVNRQHIEALCSAVREAGLEDFCFVRDVEHYKQPFDDPKQLWERAYDELRACGSLLVDVSDAPSGGRLVEAGMAFALRKPVIVVKKRGAGHKGLFDGIASTVIEYDDVKDLSRQLKRYDDSRNFTVTDRSAVALLFLLVGGVIGWGVGRYAWPLGIIAPIVYWLVARRFYAPLRAFDRVIIYIPLLAVWGAGFYLLMPLYLPLAIAWLIGYWLVTLFVLDKLKFSL